MKKIVALLLAGMMLFTLFACNKETPAESQVPSNSQEEESPPVEGKPLAPSDMDRETVEGWSITSEWKIVSASEDDGDSLSLTGENGSEAFKTVYTLRDAWDLSATIAPASGTASAGFTLGTTDLMSIGWITLNYEGGNASLLVGYQSGGNFNELLKAGPFAAGGPLTLTVSKLAEDRKLVVGVYDGETELYSGVAEEVPSTFMRLMGRAGLRAEGNAEFTQVKIITYSATGGTEIAIEAIDAGPHVDNPDYIFNGAVFNVVNGEERIIIDSTGEGYAWYIGEKLEGDWTVKCRVQIGNFNGAAQGCARFSFGGERVPDDEGIPGNPDMSGMFTALVDNTNNFYFQESQQLLNDKWSVKAGGSSWIQIYYPIFDMTASHKAGEDVLNIQFIDLNGDIIHTVKTRDYQEGLLDQLRYFGFFVYQSQIQVTRMEYLHEYTELSKPQEVTPPSGGGAVSDYTPYTDFGATEDTADWDLGGTYKFKSTVNGDVLGADGVGMGDNSRAKYLSPLGDEWSVDAVMRFENTGGDVYSGRIYLYGEDSSLKGIISAKMDKEGKAWLEAQMFTGDWVNIVEGMAPVEIPTKDIWLSVGKKADGTLIIRTLDEQGTQFYFGETGKMTNIEEVTSFDLVFDNTCGVFDRVKVGTSGGTVINMGAPVADFGTGKNSAVWTLGDDTFVRAGTNAGEAILFNSDINTNASAPLGDGFSVSLDLMYAKAYGSTFQTRFFFRDGANNPLVIVDFMASGRDQYTFRTQKNENGGWATIAGEDAWKEMAGRNVSVEISKAAGASKLHVRIVDLAGTVLADADTEEFEGIKDLAVLEIQSSQTVTVLDNIILK